MFDWTTDKKFGSSYDIISWKRKAFFPKQVPLPGKLPKKLFIIIIYLAILLHFDNLAGGAHDEVRCKDMGQRLAWSI